MTTPACRTLMACPSKAGTSLRKKSRAWGRGSERMHCTGSPQGPVVQRRGVFGQEAAPDPLWCGTVGLFVVEAFGKRF